MFTHSQVLFIEYVDPQGRGVVVSRESTNKSLVSRVKSCVLSSQSGMETSKNSCLTLKVQDNYSVTMCVNVVYFYMYTMSL
mgnify:CR=1 FL=1